jgi:pectinesterase
MFPARRVLLIIMVGIGLNNPLQSQPFDIVVAADGSGDYRTIQKALDAVPSNASKRTKIFIKNGTYNQKIYLSSTKRFVSLIGESVEGVIITWNDYAGKTPLINTAESYTFLAEGNDLYAENLTVMNTAGSIAQAVAIRVTGDRQVFKNCRFIGYQDTYYAHKNRQYNLNCYIEGATDFIFGESTAVFDSCEVQCVKGGHYITAPSDTKLTSQTPDGTFYHGLLFISCILNSENDVPANSYFLGRPWQPNASSVFINCLMGDFIKSEGWSVWEGTNNHLSGCYAEYQSKDYNGDSVDVSQRVEWSKQLTYDEVTSYYSLDYFFKKDTVTWNPALETIIPEPPENLLNENSSISWAPVPDVCGYVLFRNDTAIAFPEANYFTDFTVDRSKSNIYYVRSVSCRNGALSPRSESITVIPSGITLEANDGIIRIIGIDKKSIYLSEIADISLYNLNGILIKEQKYSDKINIENLIKGIYLIKMKGKDGRKITDKIIINPD